MVEFEGDSNIHCLEGWISNISNNKINIKISPVDIEIVGERDIDPGWFGRVNRVISIVEEAVDSRVRNFGAGDLTTVNIFILLPIHWLLF